MKSPSLFPSPFSPALFALAAAATPLALGCGGSDTGTGGSTTTGSGGSGATGGATTSTGGSSTGGSGGSGATGGSTTSTGGSSTGGTGTGGSSPTICGGKMGSPCAPDEFCDYEGPVPCGQADGTGTCTPRPETCPKNCPGVCACDGQTYCNDCLANAAGVDVLNPDGPCVTPVDCQQAKDAISAIAGQVHTCTAVVRLDYQSLALKSYNLGCAPYASTNETMARATAQSDTGFGQSGQLLSGAMPEDEYVFWLAPGDFGGVGVVNARNGTSVFGGGIVWNGAGQISYPPSFSPPDGLGPNCISSSPMAPARGFDLSSGQPLPQADVDAAMNMVWTTALPDGLWQNSYVFDAVVLLYPPTVGALDPATAEWVVLVNSGWLD